MLVMMPRNTVRLVCLLIFCPFLLAAQNNRQISLEDIWLKGTFAIQTVPAFNAMKNGSSYTQIDEGAGYQEINEYALSTGKLLRTIYKNNRTGAPESIAAYQFSQDEQKLLLFGPEVPVYRRSALHKVWVADLKSSTITLLADTLVLHASFNPQGDKVAYVRDNNLFIKDVNNGAITAVTDDGMLHHVINGNCDWVYEEEFEFTQAYQWSPDGQFLAYYRFDESQVKEYTLPYYEGAAAYPRWYTYKYPKAGEDNSLVSIHVYQINGGATVPAAIGEETDQYIPRIKWADDKHLCIYRLNRLQNHLELLLTDATSGASKLIYEEKAKEYVEINDNLHFLEGEPAFIINSERNGYNHLYRWNWEQKELRPITSGNWDVAALVGFDARQQIIYFTAGMQSPLQRHLYGVSLQAGAKPKDLTPEAGMHEVVPCNGLRYFLVNHSTMNKVPEYVLIDNKGKKIRTLEDNQILAETMKRYDWAKVETLQIPNDSGVLLNAYMMKPVDFDPKRQYPVLMFQYSGPGSQEVMDKFPLGNYWWHQYLAQRGYIIVCADGTGTGGRGLAFKNKTYLQLGKYESEDQIAVAAYLAGLTYVDKDRIGIWGWSFGGFMSSTCILKAPERFKLAIAVAPVTNWRYYDNIYTERYMRRPQENPQGYDANAPERMAARLKGKFLLIHGTADDNVHFQHAAILSRELIKANKQFSQAYYPNNNHGISGGNTRLQLYRLMTDFLVKEL